ncbi:MAG: alpha/beta fold hydrolase [Chloroflexi bacterium]|nr:alpha/beta fold hydrolase [Chloroflexota bacterium]
MATTAVSHYRSVMGKQRLAVLTFCKIIKFVPRTASCWLYSYPVLLLGTAVLLLAFFHNRATQLVAPPRSYTHQTPANFGISDWQDITFTTSDGLQLSGWYIPAQGKDGATLIFVHGLGSNRSSLLDQAAMLAADGYGAILFDLRAHGRSEGEKSSWGLLEVADIEAALIFLQQQSEVNSEKIGVIGHSMGGAIAIRAAAQIPAINVVVAENTYTNFADNKARLTVSFARLPEWTAPLIMRWAEAIAGVDSSQLAPLKEVAAISPRPILFIQGGHDKTVHVQNGSILFETAVSPKEHLLIPAAGHNNLFQSDSELLSQRLNKFLTQYLQDS